jgi:DNA-binding beta-propeller fold protein YncE|tara:strand:- start:1987 stop:3339 length:1353 start_codon:yes stop_codon:yes gene_type:complete
MRRATLYIIISFFIWGCLEKMPLPSDINVNTEFVAGDTTYLLVNPIWDDTYGFITPIEISIAPDGHVFVADSAAKSIFVLDQSGNMLNGYSSLMNMNDIADTIIYPIDIDIDQKMNVFFIDGSNRIYRWNQYWNKIGIESYASFATFLNPSTGDTIRRSNNSIQWFELINHPDYIMIEVEWSNNQSIIDSILLPHVFFEGSWSRNLFADLYYESEKNLFSGISTTLGNDNFMFAQDHYHNRIIKILMERSQYIKLVNGEKIWVHSGTFEQTVVSEGTGAGTVNAPLGIDIDYAGNLYYSQGGEFFSIHKVKPVVTGAYTVYQSAFQEGTNEIMDLFRFTSPADVAVDLNQNIYVANTEDQEIQVFDYNGKFFRKAGVDEITIDTTMYVEHGSQLVEIDTFIVKELKGFITRPQAITVDKRGVIYICDTPSSRVLRYRLSNQLDEDLQPIQ